MYPVDGGQSSELVAEIFVPSSNLLNRRFCSFGTSAMLRHHQPLLCPAQFDHMALLTKSPIITNFLIYAWIEQPHKQEVLQETMDLLVNKVLEPYSGDCKLHFQLYRLAQGAHAWAELPWVHMAHIQRTICKP